MHKRQNYYGCYACCLCIILSVFINKIYAQADSSPLTIRKELLSAYTRLENHLVTPAVFPCAEGGNPPTEQVLDQAWQYNLEGNWQCCEQLLAGLAKRQQLFTAVQKLHLLLTRAGYFSAHQLFDSANRLATLCRAAGCSA